MRLKNSQASPKTMQWFQRKNTSSEINMMAECRLQWECKAKGMKQKIEYWDVESRYQVELDEQKNLQIRSPWLVKASAPQVHFLLHAILACSSHQDTSTRLYLEAWGHSWQADLHESKSLTWSFPFLEHSTFLDRGHTEKLALERGWWWPSYICCSMLRKLHSGASWLAFGR